MFKFNRKMTKEVKRIQKYLRSMRKQVLKEEKKYEFVGYTLCCSDSLTEEDYNRLKRICQKKGITVEDSDIGNGCYWFKLLVNQK